MDNFGRREFEDHIRRGRWDVDNPTTRNRQGSRSALPDVVERAVLERHVEKVAAALRQYFETLCDKAPEDDIERILTVKGNQTRANRTESAKPNEEHEELGEIIADWLQAVASLIPPALYVALEEVARMGLTGALNAWSALLSLDLCAPKSLVERLNEWVKDECDRLIGGVNHRTQSDIVAVISEGMAAGLSLTEILRNIQAYFENGGSRAMTYGWFETYSALYWGEYLANKALGATLKRWVTLHDLRSCRQCLANEAEGIIPIDQPFASGHQHPLAHYWCRCRAEYFGVTPEGALDAMKEV